MAEPPDKNIDDVAEQEAQKLGQLKKQEQRQQAQKKKLQEQDTRLKTQEAELSDLVGPKEQPGGGLEGKTQGFFETLRSFSFWDWIKVGAVNTVGALLGGGIINLASTTLSYVAAHYLSNRKKGFEKKSLIKEMYLGAAMTPALNFMYSTLHTIANPFLRYGGWLLGGVPVVNSYFLGAQYIIKEYSPLKLVKGLFTGETYKLPFKTADYIGKNLWSVSRALLKYLAVPFYFVLNYTPLAWNVPVSAIGRVALRYVLQKGLDTNKANYKKDTSPTPNHGTGNGR
ncbi:MAG: hypothetical protein GXP63_00055 [DPANN group archaeon]|nr:hypothetical protein [DPANN group archaeon]